MNVLYPQFLYGLFAIAIPVFIHLFNLRRHKVVYFSNTAQLKNVQKKTRSTSKLRHLLTLLSRILFIAALSLAFAQPYFTSQETAVKSTKKGISLFVDNSLSMDVSTPEGTPFSRSLQYGYSVLDDLNPRDKVQLLTNDFSGRDELALNANDAAAQLENLEISASSKTLSEVLNRTRSTGFQNQNEEFYRFVISDFQVSFWDPEEIEDRVNGKTIFIPVNSTQNPNLSVDSVAFSSPVRYPNVKDSLFVRLNNTAADQNLETKVELRLNDKLQSVINVDLPPGITDTILYFNVSQTGMFWGEVRIDDASAQFDNTLFFTFRVPDQYNVVEITESKKPRLDPVSRVYGGDPFFNYSYSDPGSFDFAGLEGVNLLIVTEVKTAQSTFWSELASYIVEGGQVMFFPNAKNEELNNLFLSRIDAGSFEANDTIPGEVAEVEYDHNLLKGVFESRPKNALLPGYSHFMRYNSLGKAFLPFLKNKKGDAVLSEINAGEGKLYLWSINPSNSEIAGNTLWLPILYKAVFLSAPQTDLYNVIGGNSEVIIENFRGGKSGISIVSQDGSIRFKPEVYASRSGFKLDVHDQIKKPGIYKVVTESDELLSYAAFNYQTEESKLEFLNVDVLESAADLEVFDDVEVWKGDFDLVQAKMGKLEVESTLWPFFILAACLFLAIEILFLRFIK